MLILAAIIVFVLLTIIADLPFGSSRTVNVDNTRSVMSEIATDVAPCNYAVNEAVGFDADVAAARLTASDLSELPALLSDDYDACSFTNGNIDDLAGISAPNSSLGKALNGLVSETLSWCSTDGMSVIGYIAAMIEHHAGSADASQLVKSEDQLNVERTQVENSISALRQLLHTRSLPEITLVHVP